jgi:hypothetical protein
MAAKNSHVGGYSAEDIAVQLDARDYQEIDAEEVDTQVESSACEGSQHRFPAARNMALWASVVAAAYPSLR